MPHRPWRQKMGPPFTDRYARFCPKNVSWLRRYRMFSKEKLDAVRRLLQ